MTSFRKKGRTPTSEPRATSSEPVARRLSIIVPVYNESGTIQELLDRVTAARIPLQKELIVVDDGSTDGTDIELKAWLERVYSGPERRRASESPDGPGEGDSGPAVDRRFSVRLLHQPNQGKGAALRAGLEQATGELVLFQDADLELDPVREFPRLLAPIMERRAQVVFGARDTWHVRGSHTATRLANWFLNLLTRCLFGGSVTDMETAYKCVPTELLRSLELESSRFDIEPEITAKLLRRGVEIMEVPIEYRPRTVTEGKKINWWDGLEAVFTLIWYRLPFTVATPVEGAVATTSAGERPGRRRQAAALTALILVVALVAYGLAAFRALGTVFEPPSAEARGKFSTAAGIRCESQHDLFSLDESGVTRVHRTLELQHSASKPLRGGQITTWLPARPFKNLRAWSRPGELLGLDVEYTKARKLRVDVRLPEPLEPGARPAVHLEGELEPSLRRTGGEGTPLVWEIDALPQTLPTTVSRVELELPAGVSPSSVTTVDQGRAFTRSGDHAQRLQWMIDYEPLIQEESRAMRIAIPAARLVGARVAEAQSPGRYVPVAALAALSLVALGIAWSRRRWGGVAPAEIGLIVTLGGASFFMLQPRLLEDNFSYQCYARTVIAQLDLDLLDEQYLYNSTNAFVPSLGEPIGPTGAALFLTAPYGIAMGLGTLANACGAGLPLNGFTSPFTVAIGFCTVLLGGLGCFCLFALLRETYDSTTSAISVLALVFGTNLGMMIYMWTASTHVVSFALVTVFLTCWYRFRGRLSVSVYCVLGLLAGLAIQTRFQNLPLAALPLIELIPTCWAGTPAQRRDARAGFLGFVAMTLVGFSAQSIAWCMRDGSAAVDLYGVTRGRFTNPLARLTEMFVNRVPGRFTFNGLLTAQPVLIPALLGLPFVIRRRFRWGCELLGFLILELLIVGSYQRWSGRLMFSTPYLICCTPVFAFGLAATLDLVRNRLPAAIVGLCLTIMIGANLSCVVIQQAHEQCHPVVSRVPLVESLARLLDPIGPNVNAYYREKSSDFALLLRCVTDGVQSGRWALTMGPIALTLLAVVALAWIWKLVAALDATTRPRSWKPALHKPLIGCVLLLLSIDLFLLRAGLRTERTTRAHWLPRTVKREIEVQGRAISSGAPVDNRQVDAAFLAQRVYLVSFLDGMRDIVHGAKVALLELEEVGGAVHRYPIRAGQETAAHDVNRPGSRATHGDAAVCHEWLTRDGTSSLYRGQAYGMCARLPRPARIRSVRLRWLGGPGSLITVVTVLASTSTAAIPETLPEPVASP